MEAGKDGDEDDKKEVQEQNGLEHGGNRFEQQFWPDDLRSQIQGISPDELWA